MLSNTDHSHWHICTFISPVCILQCFHNPCSQKNPINLCVRSTYDDLCWPAWLHLRCWHDREHVSVSDSIRKAGTWKIQYHIEYTILVYSMTWGNCMQIILEQIWAVRRGNVGQTESKCWQNRVNLNMKKQCLNVHTVILQKGRVHRDVPLCTRCTTNGVASPRNVCCCHTTEAHKCSHKHL